MRTSVMFVTVLALAGCCCPSPCANVDPLREIGVDFRGIAEDETPQVLVEITSVWVPESEVGVALGEWRPVASAPVHTVPDDVAERMPARWSANEAVEVVSAPIVLAVVGQTATIFIGDVVPTERRPGETGFEFDVRSAANAFAIQVTPEIDDTGRIHLDFEAAFKEDAPEGADSTSGYVTRLSTPIDSADGGYTLVGTWVPIERSGVRFVQATLVHVRQLTSG